MLIQKKGMNANDLQKGFSNPPFLLMEWYLRGFYLGGYDIATKYSIKMSILFENLLEFSQFIINI